jgi:hypothetical protein
LSAAINLRWLSVVAFVSAAAKDSNAKQGCDNDEDAASDEEDKVCEVIDLAGRRGQRLESVNWTTQDRGLRDPGTEDSSHEQRAYMRRQAHQFRRPLALEDNAIDVSDFVCSDFAWGDESL